MVKTASTMLPLGAEVPGFRLPDTTSDQWVSDTDLTGEKGHGIFPGSGPGENV